MSYDTIDALHAAEDEVGRLRTILDSIHEAMVSPFEWSADTSEAVANILVRNGYVFPDLDAAGYYDDAGELCDTFAGIAAYQPAPYCRGCEDPDDCDANACGCPCHDNEGADQ